MQADAALLFFTYAGVAQKVPHDFEAKIRMMKLRIAYHILVDKVSPGRVYSMDETFVSFRLAGSTFSYALYASTHVDVAAGDDKRGFTLSMTCKMSGELQPMSCPVQICRA